MVHKKKNVPLYVQNILLFKNVEMCNSGQLKYYLRFLYRLGVAKNLKFSYIEKTSSLIPNLTLEENITLDIVAKNLGNGPKLSLSELIKKTNNAALNDLYLKIENPKCYPKEASSEMKKITLIIKALLMPVDYLFIDGPENDLGTPLFKSFLLALKYQLNNFERTAIVIPESYKLWHQYADKYILKKNESHNQFLVESSHSNYIKNIEEVGIKTEDGHLIFYNVEKLDKRSA